MLGLLKAVLARQFIVQDLRIFPFVDNTLRKLCIFTQIVLGA